MKKIVFVLIAVVFVLPMRGQEVSSDDYMTVVSALKQENWESAFEQSSQLLQQCVGDSSDYHAMMVYANIYSAAGMVVDGKMSFSQMEDRIKGWVGQKILMPAHPVTIKNGGLNQVKFELSDSLNKAFVAATNPKGFNIFCFENFFFKTKLSPDDYPARSIVRCGGVLAFVELNPNKSKIWICRLRINDAYAQKAKKM